MPPRYAMNNMMRRPVRPMEPQHPMPYHYAPPGYAMHPGMDENAMRAQRPPIPPPIPHPPTPADSMGHPVHVPQAPAAAPGPPGASGPTPTVYLATYSSVPVYEITVRGIALMRRRSDGYLNATQILKIAGIEKAKRTRILEREILTGEHEKVQGGYGTFQGTWIPLQRSQELAVTYGVYPLIRPLLDFDPSATRAVSLSHGKRRAVPETPETPETLETPMQGLATARSVAPAPTSQQPRFLTLLPPRSDSHVGAGAAIHTPTPGTPHAHNGGVPPGSLPDQKQALGAYAAHGYMPQGVLLPPADVPYQATKRSPEALPDERAVKRRTTSPTELVHDLNALVSSGELHSAARPVRAEARDADTVHGPRFANKAAVPNLGDERERKAREQLTGLFVDDYAPDATPPLLDRLHALLAELAPHASALDLVIDDHGHTALHWASALCRLPLVKMLTALPRAQGGANIFVGNYAGETALHRSVLVTNAYEMSQFSDLLDLLAASLQTRDHRKRTVLHHIALVAGVKGRAAPAKYYLGCVLDKITASGQGPGALLPQYASMLDAQDDEGETALSIAARLGNTNMIKMLLDAGARKDLPNYLGITPLDWGITNLAPSDAAPATVLNELVSFKPTDVVKSLANPPPGPVKKSEDVLEKLVQTLEDLQCVFDREASAKHEAVETTQVHLQAATRELAARRRQIGAAQAAVNEREEARQMAANLERALLPFGPASDAEPCGPFGHDIAERAAAVLHAARTAQPSEYSAQIVRLRWLLGALGHECDALTHATEALVLGARDRQQKYLAVVAKCANIAPDKVDGMLDELLSAVESMGTDANIASVSNFMQKVGRTAVPAHDAAMETG
ncbi:transcriptional regulator swi6 [Malassezia vespertilionis]|uniref:Swi6p n=1 Tax=Malassezia vespertilionis TaxID=2020962 RepID=A0A2N1J6Z0_9BASI|nr:transcriptional regulator swi6 [Malassezia vespertilionis]PKI82317.1 Swi6p [Malassezia vespertilionis]WFD08156.1 transcriptional regulator swi6 [Malassezia vespertilionis]